MSQVPGPLSAINPSPARSRFPSIFSLADIPKPQLSFPDPVDNSLERPLSNPKLSSKPHAMVPIDFEVPLNYEPTGLEKLDPSAGRVRREREVRLRQHPYFYETRHLPYPEHMFLSSPSIAARPMEEMGVEFVDSAEQLEEMVKLLKQAKEIAFDLEHHNTRSYYGFTSLLQISTRERDWVVDPLALRCQVREGKLGDVLVDPSIVKVCSP